MNKNLFALALVLACQTPASAQPSLLHQNLEKDFPREHPPTETGFSPQLSLNAHPLVAQASPPRRRMNFDLDLQLNNFPFNQNPLPPPTVLKGYVTRQTTSEASRCVEAIEDQFGTSPQLNLNSYTQSFRLSDPTQGAYGTRTHNQGVGFLGETLIQGQRFARAVLSFNANDQTGLMVVSRSTAAGTDLSSSPTQTVDYRQARRVLKIQNVPEYGNHSHPGGLQAHGDYVAIAMEQPVGSTQQAGVYFVRVDGFEPRHIHTHLLTRSSAHPQVRLDAAATVGFVKLETGHFLMALSGADHGQKGIWFFRSRQTEISPNLSWQLLDFWDPSTRMPGGVCDLEDGKIASDCFIGGGGATNLVTGCDGQIYLIALTGTAGRGKDDEYAQVMRVGQSAAQPIELTSIWEDKRQLGRRAIAQVSFRWAGGVQVTPEGKLVLLATERRTRQGDNATVDGIMRRAGHNRYRL